MSVVADTANNKMGYVQRSVYRVNIQCKTTNGQRFLKDTPWSTQPVGTDARVVSLVRGTTLDSTVKSTLSGRWVLRGRLAQNFSCFDLAAAYRRLIVAVV